MPASQLVNSPKPRKKKTRKVPPKTSRAFRPPHMTLEQWQETLRREHGREQDFKLTSFDPTTPFTDYSIHNPASKSTYRVTIRGAAAKDNSCACPDFTTNSLGTCKHIEYTLARIERKRGFKEMLKAGFKPERGEVYVQYGSRREVRFLPPARMDPALKELVADYFDDDRVLKPEMAGTFDVFLEAAREHDEDLECREEVHDYLAGLRDGSVREKLVKEMFPKGIRSAAFKDLLKVPLYDYQREGALFAARSGRCLIGDEMGLGKTIQGIAAAEIMAQLFGVERVLVVCPTSLKHQWKNEVAKFTERTVQVIEGMAPQRKAAYETADAFFVVTNYDTLHTDLEWIEAWSPDLVILDEAQRIKNWQTRAARTVKKIRSPHAVVLTGTPLENRVEELISIVQFVDQHRLGPTYKLLDEHQTKDENGRVIGYRNLDRLAMTLSPVLLRRRKAQVLQQLPERMESIVYVPMTELQRKYHDEAREIVSRIVQKWKRFKFLSEADKQRLMMALQSMRMSCDDAYLCGDEAQGLKVNEIATVLAEMLEDPGMKVVVFSSWLKMHELLTAECEARGIGHVLFHGGVPGKQRGALVEKFRDDPDCKVFFATDAGGVGLNLQFASAVINCDLPWNPAVLGQRIGRVHRMGQKNAVRVVNFVARGTIEEGMLSVLEFKGNLAAGILDGGETEIRLGGSRLTKFIETVESATGNIPAAPAPGTEAEEAKEAVAEFKPNEEPKPDAAPNPFEALMKMGTEFLKELTPSRNTDAKTSAYVQRDPKTGENYLKLPVPDAKLVEQAVQAFGMLLAAFKK